MCILCKRFKQMQIDDNYIDYFVQLLDAKRHQLEMEGLKGKELHEAMSVYREKIMNYEGEKED